MANYFSIFLVSITALTGFIWLVDKYVFAAKRAEEGIEELPFIVDNAQQFFPIFALVTLVRSFLYEPFQIPSGSMMPTLLVGDFILVEKFSYGLRDPVTRTKFIETGEPKRGDVAVFKFPDDEGKNDTDFIKRVVGLPGDKVIYANKQIFIQAKCDATEKTKCGEPKAVKLVSNGKSEFSQNRAQLDLFTEQLGEVEHQILRHPFLGASATQFYSQPGTKSNEWLVPEGHYFVLGDNRDNSRDSRFWGFVPEQNLVGQATAIWISFEFERGSDSFLPAWIPTDIRFSRIGGFD